MSARRTPSHCLVLGAVAARVATVTLAALGLADGGELSDDVTAFTAVGSYLTGATQLLDTITLTPTKAVQ